MSTVTSRGKVFLLATSVFCLPMLAETAPAAELLSEEDIFGEIPVSYTATRLEQSVKDSPVSITIIDKEMIEAYDPHELVDVLRLVPGFQVAHSRGYRSTTSYHGLGSEYASRMQVQIDGRSVYTPLLGHVEWAELPLEAEDIERIEVIRGPNAASYGANSFTAIVNIITKRPADTIGSYFKITNGSRATQRYLARYGDSTGKIDYRVTASYRKDNGFDAPEFPDDKQLSTLVLRADYQPSLKDTFEFQFGYRDSKRQDGDVIPFSDAQVDPLRDVEGTTHYQLARWRHQVSDKENFSLQFYHNYQHIDDTFRTDFLDNIFGSGFSAFIGVPDQQVLLSNERLLHRYDLEFQHNFQYNDDLRVVWGASARYEESGAAEFFDFEENHDFIENTTFRLFAHGEWKPSKKWTVNAGALIEDSDLISADISPRFAVNYHFSPNHTVRAGISRAYRNPTVFETNADLVSEALDAMGNTVELNQIILSDRSINPERLTSFEIAYIGNFPQYGLNVDAKIFYDKLDNIINDVENRDYTDPITAQIFGAGFGGDDVFYYDNVGSARLKGFEAQLQYRPNRDTRIHLGYTSLRTSGTFLDEINRNFPGDQTFERIREAAPKSIGTLQVIHDLEHDLRASVAFHHYSKYEFSGGDRTEPYSVLNARLAKKFRHGNSEGKIAVSFQNLLGEYFDYEREQRFENRMFLSLEYGFN